MFQYCTAEGGNQLNSDRTGGARGGRSTSLIPGLEAAGNFIEHADRCSDTMVARAGLTMEIYGQIGELRR